MCLVKLSALNNIEKVELFTKCKLYLENLSIISLRGQFFAQLFSQKIKRVCLYSLSFNFSNYERINFSQEVSEPNNQFLNSYGGANRLSQKHLHSHWRISMSMFQNRKIRHLYLLLFLLYMSCQVIGLIIAALTVSQLNLVLSFSFPLSLS